MRGRKAPIAKITPPTHLVVFPRKRLFSALDGARKKRAVWVCGPPGAGKTVLVSSYVQTRKQGCIWYQMDEGDGDPATLFVAEKMAKNKPSTIVWAMGQTQHTNGNASLPVFAR